MPSVQSPATILVTGGTGFIGAHVVKDLLERGYNVRAAVRTPAGGEYLKKISPGHETNITYTIVKDITDETAYDDAVKGVDAILHLATPVDQYFAEDINPQDFIGPAIGGTISILKSAKRYGTSVKRVIITSSVATIGIPGDTKDDVVFDETMWNDAAVAATEKGNTNGMVAYTASKVLAEKAAFQFIKDNSDVKFDIVSLLPSATFGPYIHFIPSKEKLGTSQRIFIGLIEAEQSAEQRVVIWAPHVDVRDVATLHSLALENDNVGGERLMLHSGLLSAQILYDALNSTKHGPAALNVPKGTPGSTRTSPRVEYKSKILGLFPGFQYRDFEDTAKSMLNSLVDGKLYP